ncbi:DUF6677 family protein [Rheinheimera sp. MMS21-TC3]|uniref:DUF6677 family protein n=1 Tax=Rheinheimera sp. MMS21-TC3 TaxID=3072790 RepID=UPI0028C4857A|nr:DUF6677 family protein [Rheinheimera sp. MMS21-TC3]WNO60218.1 DUF6677 family protein [Rheinheimera sp. MMS21-TC3]
MNKSVKALLLSAFLYPGAGHFFLKKYVMSAIFVVAFSIPLLFIFSSIISKAQQIAEQLSSGQIPFDSAAIVAAATDATTELVSKELSFNLYMLIIIWVIAIIDAYRLGSKEMKKHA